MFCFANPILRKAKTKRKSCTKEHTLPFATFSYPMTPPLIPPPGGGLHKAASLPPSYGNSCVHLWGLGRAMLAPSLSGLEPIRFLSANICLYFGKNSCNIRILLQIFASSFLNICSIETENTHRRINFRWIWVARAADKCGLFKASDAKRRENLSPRGLLVQAHLGYALSVIPRPRSEDDARRQASA